MFKNSIETKILIESNIENVWQELINFEEYKNWNPAIYEVSGVLNEGEILKIVVKINGSTMVFKPKILKYKRIYLIAEILSTKFVMWIWDISSAVVLLLLKIFYWQAGLDIKW